MRATRLSTFIAGFMLIAAAETVFHLDAVGAAAAAHVQPTASAPIIGMASGSASPVRACTRTLAPMRLGIAFTSNVADRTSLHLRLPWGSPGDAEGRMVEDYGLYNGDTIEEHLPVYDVTSGSLHLLSGHNAIDIALDSGTPLYAVTSGTVYANHNWTIPGWPQGYAAIVISDSLRDDQGDAIAFLYGHVREFDTQNGQHVGAGDLIAKSGGGANDPGRGFTDMPNVHFEVIESAHPLSARAGTVNPHQFLEDLYTDAGRPSGCSTVA
jgi:murein DD-endopeptidase MepM/ murein hydrolase activator NlpD